MLLLGLLVLCVEHLSKASFSDDLPDFKVVKNCAPIEVLAYTQSRQELIECYLKRQKRFARKQKIFAGCLNGITQLTSECGIDDVSVSKKLQVLVEKIDATLVVDLGVVSVMLALELLAGLLYEVVQSQVLVQSHLEFFFRLVDTSVQSYYNLFTKPLAVPLRAENKNSPPELEGIVRKCLPFIHLRNPLIFWFIIKFYNCH